MNVIELRVVLAASSIDFVDCRAAREGRRHRQCNRDLRVLPSGVHGSFG